MSSQEKSVVTCGVVLTEEDLQRLTEHDLLNDKVIRAYLKLVVYTAAVPKSSILLSDSFFLEQFQKSGYDAVERAFTKDKLLSADLWLLPVNANKVHWSLIVADFTVKIIFIYDSLQWKLESYVSLIILFLERKGFPFNSVSYRWNVKFLKDIPVQKSDVDCGIFCCQYAKHVAFNQELCFTQDDIPMIRQEMTKELIDSKLYWPRKRNTAPDSSELEPHLKQLKVVQSKSTFQQSACALPSLSSKSISKPVVCSSKSSVVSSSVVLDSKCSSQPASGILTSSSSKSISKPVVCSRKSSLVSSSVVPDSKCLSQSASVTSFSTPATSVAGTKGLLNFPPDLQSLLPSNYSYHLELYEDMPKGDFLGAPAECFRAKFYIKLETEEAASNWIADFQQTTQTTYRILKGSKTTGSLILFKTLRHCQHYRKYFPPGQVPKKGEMSLRQKKTDCPSRLTLRVYCNRPRNLQKLPVSDHLCEVEITYNHNHPVNSAHSLSFRDISEETKAKFYQYFACGHSAASARHQHEFHLQLSADAAVVEKLLADRATNPNVQDVSRLFQAWRFQQHGSDHGPDMFDRLEEEVAAYNKSHDDSGRAAVQRFTGKSDSDEGKPLILAICSPIMYRAHKYIQQSSELVFMDATSSLDRFSCPTYILSTGSAAGAVPLGVFVVSNETASTITDGLDLLKSIMPSDAFFGKGGNAGPTLFLTDELASQRQALRKVWPNARQLLCLFHYLQRWWKWLWEAKQGVNIDDRKVIMEFVRKLVYAETLEDLRRFLSHELKDPSSKIVKYPNVLKRVKEMQDNEEQWAIAYRSELCIRGKHTNNYSEASVRILKDRVFERTRAYNLVQLFQFLSTTLELYFEKRLLDIAHNRPSPHLKLPSEEIEKVKEPAKLERESDAVYRFQYVNDHTRCYHVDVELGMCSCPVGMCGSPCKHQAFALRELGLPSVNFVPEYSSEGRRLFAVIALGETHTPDVSFFASIHEHKKQQQQASKESTAYLMDQPNYSMIVGKACDVEMCDEHVISSSEKENVDINETHELSFGLQAVFDDMNERLKENDPNYISGVAKFLKSYQSLQDKTISTPSIASALHTFSMEAGLQRRHQGVLIPVQTTATSRRRKGVPRGRKPIPQGRPPKLSKVGKNNKELSMKKFKPRKPHNLSSNISKNTLNAQIH